MTTDEMRIAVAKSVGWRLARDKKYPSDKNYWLWNPQGQPVSGNVECGWQFHLTKLPNYSADLNAMHEAEKTLTIPECYAYSAFLGKELSEWMPSNLAANWPFHATSTQRCEAYLRVKGLWK